MKHKPMRRLLSLGFLLIVLPWSALAALQVTFFQKGTATSALVQADGKTMLIDAGPEYAVGEVLRYLESAGLNKIDLLTGTLLREDHIGGTGAVLERFGANALWLPGALPDDAVFNDLRATLEASGAKITVPLPGERFKLGNAGITALDVPGRGGGDAGAPGLALRIEYGAFSFLFVSNTESLPASALQGYKADVLALGGIGESLSGWLPDGPSPRWVVLGSDAELAAEEIARTANERGIHVAQPGEDGLITFRVEGKVLRAEHAALGITTKGSVNLRKDASAKSGTLGTMPKGTVLTILGTAVGAEGLWYSVEVNGKPGFVRGDLVDEVSPDKLEELLASGEARSGRVKRPQKSNGAADDPGDVFAPCH